MCIRDRNYSVVALLIAAVAYFAIRLLPVDAAQLAVALLPAASMGCFLHYKRSVPRLPRRERNMRVKARPPLRLVTVALFFGVSFGAMKGLMAPVESDWLAVRDLLNIAAIVGGSVAIFATMSWAKMDFDLSLIHICRQ